MLKTFVGVTDNDWFEFLAGLWGIDNDIKMRWA